MRVMADGTVHATLVVRADFPLLPTKTCVAVATPAQVCGSVDRHWAFRVIHGHRVMAGFTGHTIFFPGGCSRIIAGNMANQTSTGLALGSPLFYEYGVICCMSMWATHPGSLEFCMTGSTIKRVLLDWRIAISRR